jgi:hypothetical protein
MGLGNLLDRAKLRQQSFGGFDLICTTNDDSQQFS